MAEFERKRRSPAIEKSISEIRKEDIRVAFIGTIVEKDPTIRGVIIDDGNASIRVLLPEELFEKCETGKIVRVIGLVAPALEGEEKEIKGEIIQDFSKLNKNLYADYLNT